MFTKFDTEKRILLVITCIILFILVDCVVLFNIQILRSRELKERQDSFMTSDIKIEATRGDIYDRNMNLLAKDSTCSLVYAFPSSVNDPDTTAKILSEKLDIKYNTVYKKLTDTSESFVYIARRVDTSVAKEIEAALTLGKLKGVEIGEDQKRYYTNSTYAQYILGFTGTDHSGLYGVEASYDDILSGVDGVKSVLMDTNGNVIESSSQVVKEAQNGDNLVLTLDNVIQYYVESACYNAYVNNKAKRVIAIVTDVKTNEVLGACAYPGYDLNDPWSITEDYAKSYSAKYEDEDDLQLSMWANPFSTFMYEPGSTFKLVTVSSALESGFALEESTYYCGGYSVIDGVKVNCDVYPGKHGNQDLKTALVNSCNCAMMTIVSQMGADNFYDFIYAYGFGESTGSDFESEEEGILSLKEDLDNVNLVTLGFGQGIAVTPIQLISALNAVTNGGYLYEPTIVKASVDSDTGAVTTLNQNTYKRQVISEETSKLVCTFMKAAADNYYTLRNYRSYNIGGKTGTAEKIENGQYVGGKYIASFYGIIPYDDPQISVLFIVDEPGGNYRSGSSVAAPVGASILANSYNYLLHSDSFSGDVESSVFIPDVRGMSAADAAIYLTQLGISYEIVGDTDTIVIDQDKLLCEYKESDVVVLTTAVKDDEYVVVPDVSGMSVQNAKLFLESIGLNIEIEGGGIAYQQSVKAGTKVEKNTTVTVKFRYVE